MSIKYGIWGLAVVGKSVARYLRSLGHTVSVMDARTPTEDEKTFLKQYGISYYPQTESTQFFKMHDQLVISPGIKIDHTVPTEKITAEVDLFCRSWKKPLITITGSLGKTSILHLLSELFKEQKIPCAVGGNNGVAMLDFVYQQAAYGLLELSSFQLEKSTSCKPNLAIWTNFYPNHLDRHETVNNYFLAKYQMLRYQDDTQKALVPLSLAQRLRKLTQRPLLFFSVKPYSKEDLLLLKDDDTLYGIKGSSWVKIKNGSETILAHAQQIPSLSYQENWLILLAVSDVLGLDALTFFSQQRESKLLLPAHRLETLDTINGITFINDSKSSLFQATLAAVESLQPRRIHLLLGGTSKGIDRRTLIPILKDKVTTVACFGMEAEALYSACRSQNIPASSHGDLNEAFNACLEKAASGDIVLLSPAGASFDLFKNYIERGNAFKELVTAHKCQSKTQRGAEQNSTPLSS